MRMVSYKHAFHSHGMSVSRQGRIRDGADGAPCPTCGGHEVSVRRGTDVGSAAPWLVLAVLLVVPVLVLGAWALVARADNPPRRRPPSSPSWST